MARQLRVEYEGGFYHVISRGNNKLDIFKQTSDYLHFLDLLAVNRERFSYLIHAYVLMRNHYHLLIETNQANLSRIMHALNSGYVNYFTVRHAYVGHVFQGRYKAIIIDKDNYLLELSRYIHLNPYRAQREEQLGEYRWSSIMDYESKKKDSIVYTNDVLGYFSGKDFEKRKRYMNFIREGIDEAALTNPLQEVYGGFAAGKESFLKKMLGVINERTISDDIAFRNKMKHVTDKGNIIKRVAEFYAITEEELRKSVKRSIPGRKQTIYLLKNLSGMTNSEIGALFGISYSAVSKVVLRYEQEITENNKIKKEMNKLMSHVKS